MALLKHIKYISVNAKLSLRLIGVLLSTPICIFTQNNLIINPSCEDASQIPHNIAEYNFCVNWWNPYIYTTDYFTSEASASNFNNIPNNIFGFQEKLDGNYYLGIGILDWNYIINDFAYFRTEYVGGQFKNNLVKNKTYQFEFWMSKAEKGHLYSNALDLVITYDTVIDVNNYNSYGYKVWSEQTPLEDTVNWVKVSTCFKAKGGEKAFTIGNFHEKADVNIIFPVTQNQLGGDFDYRYLDKFSLIECPTCCPEQFPNQEQVSVFSNPATSINPATIEIWLNPNTTGKLEIYDSAGRLVAEKYYSDLQNVYTFAQFASGIYHYCVSTETGFTEYGKVLVTE
jgi:hypothetical protein